jgi:hypothetical protein
MKGKLSKERVFYFGMINTPCYADLINEELYVGAASVKMVSVVQALRSLSVRACIVTMPVLGKKSRSIYQKQINLKKDGVPVFFLKTSKNSFIRKVLGLISFAFFSIQLVRSNDKVIVYNHAIEYLPALLVLYIRKVKVYQDIEDLPFSKDFSLNGIMNRFGFWVVKHLTQEKKIIVSSRIAQLLSLKSYMIIRGVARETLNLSDGVKWENLISLTSSPLCIHFGGTLQENTGIDLFCESVEILSNQFPLDSRPIYFYVTGVGQFEKIYELADKIDNLKIKILITPCCSHSDYMTILQSCHISLALKIPGSMISDTTFPSKVIEITSFKLALISTEASDVSQIFDDASAYLLRDLDPGVLSDTFARCANEPSQVREVAKAGNLVVKKHFSAFSVGSSLATFLGY